MQPPVDCLKVAGTGWTRLRCNPGFCSNRLLSRNWKFNQNLTFPRLARAVLHFAWRVAIRCGKLRRSIRSRWKRPKFCGVLVGKLVSVVRFIKPFER